MTFEITKYLMTKTQGVTLPIPSYETQQITSRFDVMNVSTKVSEANTSR